MLQNIVNLIPSLGADILTQKFGKGQTNMEGTHPKRTHQIPNVTLRIGNNRTPNSH